MPDGGGTSAGQAIGVITIETQLDQAAAQVAAFSQQTQQQMASVGASTTKAGDSLGQLARVFGIGLGIKQLTEAAVAADQMATAFARQTVAAEALAGSQSKLNDLLDAYDKATGGAVDKATALANVTKDISLGFADSTSELSKFASAARGISLAGFGGGSQAAVEGQLQAAITTQRSQALRELGLESANVKARTDELMQADSNLTQAQAYQNAVLDEAQAKFGGLAKSTVGAVTGLEQLQKTSKNTALTLSQDLAPAVDFVSLAMSNWLKRANDDLQKTLDFLFEMGQVVGVINRQLPSLQTDRFVQDRAASDQARHGGGGTSTPVDTGPTTDQQTAISDWWAKRQDLETKLGQSLNDETTRYEQQRADSERNYQEQVTESAASFAKQRMRQQEDYERAISDIQRAAQQRDALMARDQAEQIATMQRDSAQRIGKLNDDLNRTIADQRANSADRLGGFATDRDKTIEQDRKDSADRLLQIEKNYDDQREQAALSHSNAIFDATAQADGRALFMEQRRYAQEQDSAAKSHSEAISAENDKLQQSIDNVNNAYDQKVKDEQASLEKSISQAQEAHDHQVADEKAALQQRIDDANAAYAQQLSDAHDADAQRLTDMDAAFTLQKQREDADQSDRMTQMANHHTEEMTQFDTEHNARVGQIIDHAKAERDQLDQEHNKQMKQLGDSNQAIDKAQADHDAEALRQHKLFYDQELKAFLDAQIIQMTAQLLQPGADIGTLQTAITGFNTKLGEITKDINDLIGKAPADVVVPASISSLGGAALVSTTTLPAAGGGRSLSVTFAQGAVQVYGAPGQSVEALASIIDQRILSVVQTAAGRL
jgi:hypothetical protein